MHAAISAVTPGGLVQAVLTDPAVRTFIGRDPVALVAAGKAAYGMMQGFLAASDTRIHRGVAVGPGRATSLPPSIAWYTGGHPVPDRGSVEAGRAAIRCAGEVASSGCFVVLLSGGASALLAVPVDGLSLGEKVDTTRILLAAGVPIHELNCVRKHLSAVKGGRLALATAGRVLTLAISDVVSPVEDDPSVIGSGPTAGDPTSFVEALAIVDRPGIRGRIPARVRAVLERGSEGRLSETLKASAPVDRAMYRVIGSRREAMAGALAAARDRGYTATQINQPVVGEARIAGADHPARALAAAESLAGPRCVVSSGETTVTVTGGGQGGRNQELALAAMSNLGRLGTEVVLASVGTDGVDGPTDAAGAVVDSSTSLRASRLDLASPASYLAQNNAYAYFNRLGDLIRTGPTGTNVGDLQVVLTR